MPSYVWCCQQFLSTYEVYEYGLTLSILPNNSEFPNIHIYHPLVNKGSSLFWLIHQIESCSNEFDPYSFVTAGDSFNDFSMLLLGQYVLAADLSDIGLTREIVSNIPA